MIYREIALPAALTSVALCAWQFVVEDSDPAAFLHQVPPDGGPAFVLVRMSDGSFRPIVAGPSLAAYTVPVARGFDYAGLRLRPEMALAATGIAPQPGAMHPSALEGPFAPIWCDLIRLIDGSCDWADTIAHFGNIDRGDRVIATAVDRLIASGGTMPVARLAGLSGLSGRQFRRRFHSATGMTPKQYADVQRVRRALVLSLDDPDWAGIAYESGFSDQPHFARDVRTRFGASPRRIAGYFHGIRHELLDPLDGRNLQASAAEAA